MIMYTDVVMGLSGLLPTKLPAASQLDLGVKYHKGSGKVRFEALSLIFSAWLGESWKLGW